MASSHGAQLEMSISHGSGDHELTLTVRDLSGGHSDVTYLLLQEDEDKSEGRVAIAILKSRLLAIRDRVEWMAKSYAPGHFIDGAGI